MSAADGWARDFFSGLFVELWLRAIPEEQTRQEADFLEAVLGLPAGASVLDLACGGGRHSLELAARGYRPTGVDISPEFLAAARTTPRPERPRPTGASRSPGRNAPSTTCPGRLLLTGPSAWATASAGWTTTG
jgi:SAM-dependent methyltransferase